MTRRRFVALISASVILAVVLLAVGAVLAVTETDFGRERIRRLVQSRASSGLAGRAKIYIGRISGTMFTEFAVDSFSLYDEQDSLVIATGPVRVTFDLRDILDQRLHFHTVDIARPAIHLKRHSDDVWNYRRIFPPSKPFSLPRAHWLGDYIVADSLLLHDGAFWLTEPWAPDDSLKGARRDSAVRFALKRAWPEVRESKEGLTRTRRWTRLRIDAPWVRIAHPDSIGQAIRLGALDAVENDPPTELRALRGRVRIHGDSVWVALSHFGLPASTGTASARIWWGGNKPVQMDVHAVGDSVSLSDFAWVYPNLPRTGGGRTEVFVHNDPKNLAALDFALKNMDLRTTKSRLRGDMTFATGWPVLVIKDVAVTLEPADFDLLRAFHGGTFPVDFQGQFTGRLRAAGGRIDRWHVDSADLTYRDAHVPGAVSHFTANGDLDLLYPALAKFRGFGVDLSALDLRTVTYLFPSFPRLHGTITGGATLDSIWTDVRFHDADVLHHDGPDAPSHATGFGRVTLTNGDTQFDVTLDASPISFTTVAHSYAGLPLRGTFDGPVRVQGTADRLALGSRLTGDAGTLVIDELIDMDTVGGMGARGTVRLESMDARRLFERPAVPVTKLFLAIANDVHGDSFATVRGTLEVAVDTSRVADIWVPYGAARISVADGHLHFDSMTLASTGVKVRASGGLGVAAGAHDTVRFTVHVDSLGGLRSLVAAGGSPARDTAGARASLLSRARRDSLEGTFAVEGLLAGSLADSFTASATFLGEKLLVGSTEARRLAGGLDISGLPKMPNGSLWMRLDSARVLGVGIDTVHVLLALSGADSGTLTLAGATNRPAGHVRGGARAAYRLAGDTTRVTLDTLAFVTGTHGWRLFAPAHFVHGPGGDALDSLLLRAAGGGFLAMRGALPATGEVHALVATDSLPLADVGALLQSAAPLAGYASGDLRVSGTRAAPVMRLGSRFHDVKYGTLAFPYFTLDANYAERRLATRLDFFETGQAVATFALALPADFAFATVAERFPDEPITGRFTADSVNLAALASFSPQVSQPAGLASTDVAISGTLRRPLFTGRFRVTKGEFGLPRLGLRLTGFDAAIRFVPGGFFIDTLSTRSGSVAGNFMSITGSVRAPDLLDLLSDRRADTLDLAMRAKNFQLVDSRRFARMEITDDIRLRGPFKSATLTGRIAIDKADFYLSDLARKTTVVDLDDPELFQDSALLASKPPTSNIPPDVREALRNLRVQDLDVSIGDKVWLRSEESAIKLAGAVQIQGSDNKALTGRIDVQRGTYRLDLGIVQRTFQVDSGHISFYGDADRSGALDIWASSTVRQANRQGEDVRIIAHIGGTTVAPRPEFSSGERVELSQSEILSYLIFGQASPNDVNNTNALSHTLSASLGTVMEGALAGQLKFVDQISIQTGNTSTGTTQTNEANSVLAGSRLGVGKQIGDKTYVSANAGLCFIQSSSASTSFSQSLGVSVEQRLGTRFFLQASMEPSSAALLCKPGTSDIGSHPRQYGLDLFREWSF